MDYGDYPLLSDNPSRTTQADIVLDHVRRYNSRLVVETNAQQHAHVSVYRSEARKKNVTLLITGHYCVDDETEALSKQGWVSFDKLQPGDEILTLNMSTGLSEWKPVTDIYVSEYTGSMTLISGATINACCTPDHSWPVKALYAPKRKLRGAIRLKETVDVNTSDWVVLSAESAYDPEPLYDDDFVVLVGWAITEGSYREVGKSIRIGQSESANPEYCKEIRSLLVRCNAQFSERDNGSGTTVFAVNGGMGAKIRSVTENGKNLPAEFVLSLSSKQRNLLIETMVKADGWSQGKTMYLCSDSGSILTGFEMLCALEGSSTYRRYRKDDPGHGVVSKRSISQAMLAKLPQATSEKWSGTIWCPSTENGTFLAKRGGITYFTGNTSQNKKINFKDGVPAIAPYFENGQVKIPYRRPEDKRRSQQFIEEAVNYPLYATDDCLMAFWMAWMRIDSLLKQNRQSVITKVERPAYFNRRQAEINFPPHWTSKQREAYLLGNSPEELEEAEEVMAV
jgi:hypothetical protein